MNIVLWDHQRMTVWFFVEELEDFGNRRMTWLHWSRKDAQRFIQSIFLINKGLVFSKIVLVFSLSLKPFLDHIFVLGITFLAWIPGNMRIGHLRMFQLAGSVETSDGFFWSGPAGAEIMLQVLVVEQFRIWEMEFCEHGNNDEKSINKI